MQLYCCPSQRHTTLTHRKKPAKDSWRSGSLALKSQEGQRRLALLAANHEFERQQHRQVETETQQAHRLLRSCCACGMHRRSSHSNTRHTRPLQTGGNMITVDPEPSTFTNQDTKGLPTATPRHMTPPDTTTQQPAAISSATHTSQPGSPTQRAVQHALQAIHQNASR